MPEAWLRYQQTLGLAALVAGLTLAEFVLRLAEASLQPPSPALPRIRLVSDLHGILVERIDQ